MPGVYHSSGPVGQGAGVGDVRRWAVAARHAENGGEFYIKELGYWVDYYEPNLNIVIEYDEFAHRRKQKKDVKRQQQIETLLKCKFVRIAETDDVQNIITKIKEVL